MSKKNKKRNKAWFIRVRWSYLPNSWQGWLTYIPMLSFLVIVFIVIHHQNRSWLNTILLYIPYMVITGVVMTWIASHESR